MKMIIMISMLFFASCSYRGAGFLDRPSNDHHSSFYRPNEDFYVVSGDGESLEHDPDESYLRSPASVGESEMTREQETLREELKTLEERERGAAGENYEKHKAQLGSVSERIYYLKLPIHERRSYLESRGIYDRQEAPLAEHEKYFGVRPTTIGLGMSKDDVVMSFGRPLKVEVAGNPRLENERWVYNVNGATKYIYFESGRVGGWE